MKKFLAGLLLLSNGCVFAENSNNDDFMELDEPYQYITGAYWGISVGPTFVKHKLTAKSETIGAPQKTDFSKTQFDLGILAGFGTSFYKDYYVGIEMEAMNRFGKGTHYQNDTDPFGLKFNSQFGLNMNVRFGYLFPKQGNMVYAMIGFSRTLGKVVYKDAGGREKERSFGSYFPTVGIGFEHKINYDWNVRFDVKYSITSKDSNNRVRKPWVYEVKPQSMGVRLSVTRNI
ncbi:MAG: outer membrane beta-barrel protein [Alphaproteobacteria bacterium]|nr:outer membrane beta-barrel protein [Alphaproteobacteria bacterium]MBO7537248.1 outer membrane beta-barrel protein [Alphaproteobacteria bacterium]MBO7641643.1 outer membrane beta-barrel protein [Alphaproteobacteria bacterium]